MSRNRGRRGSGNRRRPANRLRTGHTITPSPLLVADLQAKASVAIDPKHKTLTGQIELCWQKAASHDYRTAQLLMAVAGALKGDLQELRKAAAWKEDTDRLDRMARQAARLSAHASEMLGSGRPAEP